jgi:phage N-6-adenine-methyltransferase
MTSCNFMQEQRRQPAYFRHGKDEWETPDWLFAKLDREFNFVCDVAATAENAKCKHYYSPATDGLQARWFGACWCNPPYSDVERWIEKAAYSAGIGTATVVCLVPARTDTKWWHDLVIPYGQVRLIRGRLSFKGSRGNAPFPSAIVIFRPRR